MESSSSTAGIYKLPQDTLHMIFIKLPLPQIIICRSISKPFHHLLTSPSFLHLISSLHPPLSLLALRPPHHHHHHRSNHRSPPPPPPPPPSISLLHAFDPTSQKWLKFDLSFLPFSSLSPVTSSRGLIFLWGDTCPSPDSPVTRSLIVSNPLTRSYRVLPHLGSAWSKHGSVLSGSHSRVLVLTELATLYWRGTTTTTTTNPNRSNVWLKFSSNLPSKPRSPILIGSSLYALCDVGSPWRSIWKMFACELPVNKTTSLGWSRVERSEWGDVFDILKRPRLVKGGGRNKVLMVGGLKSSFSLNASCSTILILRLDLETLEWDEAGRMPLDMYKCFQESSKFKVFGGGDKVCFSAKRVGKMALWDNSAGAGAGAGEWRWIDGAPGYGDGLLRGFVFDACLGAVP